MKSTDKMNFLKKCYFSSDLAQIIQRNFIDDWLMILEIHYKKKNMLFEILIKKSYQKRNFYCELKLDLKCFSLQKFRNSIMRGESFTRCTLGMVLGPGHLVWELTGHYLGFHLAEGTGIIWNILTTAAPGVLGDLRKSRSLPSWSSPCQMAQRRKSRQRCQHPTVPPALRAASLITAPLCTSGEREKKQESFWLFTRSPSFE